MVLFVHSFIKRQLTSSSHIQQKIFLLILNSFEIPTVHPLQQLLLAMAAAFLQYEGQGGEKLGWPQALGGLLWKREVLTVTYSRSCHES